MSDPDVIDALIARVAAQCPMLATVDEAWFAEPIDHFDSQTPAALIYLAEDGAVGQPETQRPVQRIRLTYGIWLVTKRATFRADRQALRSCLMGWEPSPEHEPLVYRGGQTTDIRGELIWWREFWTLDTWLRG